MSNDSEALRIWEGASAWAETECSAGTLLEAEAEGLSYMDAGARRSELG